MRRSVFAPLMLALAMVAGCAARQHKPPPPLFAAHTANLDITEGIKVLGLTALPPDFVPVAPPLWLLNGSTVATAGVANGHTIVIGFGGTNLASRRIIAADFGPAGPNGHIVDVVASPDGMTLATVVVQPQSDQLSVVLRDLISNGQGHSVASFNGTYEFADLTWLTRSTLALALRPTPSQPPQPQTSNPQNGTSAQKPSQNNTTAPSSRNTADPNGTPPASDNGAENEPPTPPPPANGLYLVDIGGAVKVMHLDKIDCALAHLSFSPNHAFAVSDGDRSAPPAVIDIRNQACRQLGAKAPIHVLSWAPDSAAFLFAVPVGQGHSFGVFRYDLLTGATKLIAVSSSAAAYADDGTIIAVGNSELSWRQVQQAPTSSVKAQIALFQPNQPEIQLNSLGFETTPALLARSTMVFSRTSNDAMIDALIAQPAGPPRRDLIEYSYPTHSAFVVASGPAVGPLLMSWAPDGKKLAMIDGGTSSVLTVLVPPR